MFVLITVGMRPYRYLTGFPKAKDKEITLLPIFCYQSAKKIPTILAGNIMYRLNFHSYPSHYSIPFEYHYKNTVNCRLNILQGNGTLFGILTQRFFNHYRSNKLYICAKRYLFNKLILTPTQCFVNLFQNFT